MHSDSAFQVDLPAFRGPFELLLVLVKKKELALEEIPLELIAEQFSEYLQTRGRDLEAVGDFVLQAATLLEIKSRSLLCQPSAEEDARIEAKPAAWVRHVLEYQHYRDMAESLGELEERQNRTRPRPQVHELPEQSELRAARVNLTDLIAAFDRVLRAAPRATEIPAVPALSPEQCRQRILSQVSSSPRTAFESLFEPRMTALDRVAVFLSLLQMVKDGLLRLEQDAPLETLWITQRESRSDPPALTDQH